MELSAILLASGGLFPLCLSKELWNSSTTERQYLQLQLQFLRLANTEAHTAS
jgi:hypothetical protein